MKIAYFTDMYTPEINGVVNTLKKLFEYLDKNKIEYIVFAPAYDKGTHMDEEGIRRYKGLRLAVSPESCYPYPIVSDIFAQCDRFQPDLIHVATEFGMGYKGMNYAISRNLPFVKSYHTNLDQYLSYHKLELAKPFLQAYLKWFHLLSHATLVPSKSTLDQLQAKNYKNLSIWSRGIDAETFSPSYRNDRLRETLGINGRIAILYTGRLSAEKGLDVLTEAIRITNRTHKERAVFIITGNGPYFQILQDERLENVILTGFKTGHELSEIYASCDCFAFPSGTETFGNSALEAMASGLPVVGVRSGGVTDFLVHGKNSLLAQFNDAQAFAKHLIKMIEDEDLRETLATNAVITAKSRDWDEIFDRLMNKYEEVVEGCSSLSSLVKPRTSSYSNTSPLDPEK